MKQKPLVRVPANLHSHPEENEVYEPKSTGSAFAQFLGFMDRFAKKLTDGVASFTYRVTGSVLSRLIIVLILTGFSLGMAVFLSPPAEYLPEGNRNFIFSLLLPPPGYNLDELDEIGRQVVIDLEPYWKGVEAKDGSFTYSEPRIRNLFYVGLGRIMFAGASTQDPLKARSLVPIFRKELKKIPGFYATSYQSSLFGRGIGSGRTIDVDITGPDLEQLVQIRIADR